MPSGPPVEEVAPAKQPTPDCLITIRVTKAERAVLNQAAKLCGMSFNAWARATLLAAAAETA